MLKLCDKDIPLVEFVNISMDVECNVYTISDFYESKNASEITVPHRVDFSQIIYITEGDGKHRVDDNTYALKTGSMVFVSRHQVNKFDISHDVSGFVIEFHDDIIACGEDYHYMGDIKSALDNINFMQDNNNEHKVCFEMIYTEFMGVSDNFSREIIRNAICMFLLKTIVRHHKKTLDTRLSITYKIRDRNERDFVRYKSLIKKHSHHTVSSYSKIMGVSINRLNNLSKEFAGVTAKQIIDTQIAIEAKRLLAHSHYSIKDIAIKLGFSESTNLTKFFRRSIGITPTEYREQVKIE